MSINIDEPIWVASLVVLCIPGLSFVWTSVSLFICPVLNPFDPILGLILGTEFLMKALKTNILKERVKHTKNVKEKKMII